MRLLVIGGTGLISTGITRQAVTAGHDVTLLNRGETEAEVPDSVDRIVGDRTDRAALERAAEVGPDCVIDMVAFESSDVEAAIDVFGGRVEQYVFCSTVDVYHRPVATMPIRERAAREPPVSEYGAGKAACEDRLFAAYRTEGFPVTVIRPWHTYGEGGGLIDTLSSGTAYIDRLRAGKPIVVHGDGTSVWAPCHRDDVAGAFVAAIGNHEAVGEAYHTTSTEPMTWNQYHRRAAAALDAPDPELVHVPTDTLSRALPDRTAALRDHFRFSTVFDNAKARRDLGFAQTVSWEEGVRRTVAWLDAHDEIAPWEGDEAYERVVEAWREAASSFVERVA